MVLVVDGAAGETIAPRTSTVSGPNIRRNKYYTCDYDVLEDISVSKPSTLTDIIYDDDCMLDNDGCKREYPSQTYRAQRDCYVVKSKVNWDSSVEIVASCAGPCAPDRPHYIECCAKCSNGMCILLSFFSSMSIKK